MSTAGNSTVDNILEDMIQIFPIFQKKLLRMDLGGVTGNLTRLHLAIMGMLSRGSMSVTELANSVMMTKSQMTHLIDQLVRQSIVERRPDEKDRRVINLSLTEQGRVLLDDAKQKVQENIRQALAGLTTDDRRAMSGALKTLKDIGARL
jgi:DNA-binding MarR family transcriptional regulator